MRIIVIKAITTITNNRTINNTIVNTYNITIIRIGGRAEELNWKQR